MFLTDNLKLRSRLILAPMSGITDLPFRLLNRRFGCELAFVEMINARSLGYKSKKTQRLLSTDAQDRPLGVQLLGKEPAYLLRALDILNSYKFDLLDFNAACPAPKVTKRGEGASLLKDPEKLGGILKLLVENSPVPVTVKIRLGWDKTESNTREIALAAQDAGIKAVFIHGRTKMQEYHGDVDYDVIAKVKKALRIPVIASGNIFSGELAKRMFDETGCDAVLIARGALGNPWIFREISYFLEHGKEPARPSVISIIEIMSGHLDACVGFYGEKAGVVIFRKFFSWYTKGFRKIRPLREGSSRAKTQETMREMIEACGRYQKQ
ncbi:MAG: tRNA dihydrouridine synthase DusB [Candidatus Omnitrophica bacterium]|nr:tRNA dihydrouridine synthase DusB [Candidatus Omnitrophota bacterium]